MTRQRLADAALEDQRIDLVLWQSTPSSDDRAGTYVVDSRRGRLEFERAERGEISGRDEFGTRWRWRDDVQALQLDVVDGIVTSAEYPNPFERIAGVLDASNSGDGWLTARPGCEFEVPGGKGHVGGASHGALHALDSLSPVILGGGVPRSCHELVERGAIVVRHEVDWVSAWSESPIA